MTSVDVPRFPMTLFPPFRFAIVEDGVYRGAYPSLKNYRLLRRLKLRHIISLTPEPPISDLLDFCKREDIHNTHYTVPRFEEDVNMSPSTVAEVLQIIVNPTNLPLYIHCLDGANVTGLVIACLRKLQNWNLTLILNEFSRFSRDDVIMRDEATFVETFEEEVEIQEAIPPWLWEGVHYRHHPTIRLKHTAVLQESRRKRMDPTALLLQLEGKGSGHRVATAKVEKMVEEVEVSFTVQALALEGFPTVATHKKQFGLPLV